MSGEAFAWIAAAIVGALFAALGVSPIFAARGLRREKSCGKICGIIASITAIFQFPVGSVFSAYLIWKIIKLKTNDGLK